MNGMLWRYDPGNTYWYENSVRLPDKWIDSMWIRKVTLECVASILNDFIMSIECIINLVIFETSQAFQGTSSARN